MRIALVVALTIIGAAVLASCGGAVVTTSGSDEPCIVTFAGNELCGDSGKAWCEQFASQVTADPETQSACASVGADFAAAETDTPEDRREARVAEVRSVLDQKYPELSPSTTNEKGEIVIVLNAGMEDAGPASPSERRRVCRSARAAAFNQEVRIFVEDVNSSEPFTTCE